MGSRGRESTAVRHESSAIRIVGGVSRSFGSVCDIVTPLIYIYIYIYMYILYVYVSNQIQQNKMQPEHVSEAVQYYALCVCALSSVVHGQSKRSTNDPLTLTGRPNPAQITRSH